MEDDENKRKQQISVLRDKSRRAYLEKREKDQIDMLEGDLKDEEYLFDSEELTEKEKQDYKTKKELLAIAKQYNKVHESDDQQRYAIPEEKRGQNIKDRILLVISYVDSQHDILSSYILLLKSRLRILRLLLYQLRV